MLSRKSSHKGLGSLIIAGIIGAAIAFAAVQMARPGAPVVKSGITEGPPGPTVAQPLSAPAKPTTMGAAVSALGVSVPLPKTAAVNPTDVGPVWEGSNSGGTT